ncbi:MAG: alpha/beta fold hydrolase, partial [Deltaproteobacteria bacterium]|nr:alpha/beta fold hydrolase [Nannocystaceae bacterium]
AATALVVGLSGAAWWAGPPRLAVAVLLTASAAAICVLVLVPRMLGIHRRARVLSSALTVLAVLESLGFAAALASEGVAADATAELAFDIPRAVFDVDHHFVDLPGGARVHYVDEGRGETLLLLHGNPAWSFQWRELIHGLRGEYRCVAPDYPGFGLSSAPAGFGYTPAEQIDALEQFVDALGLQDVTLVMQDWGGPIGLGLAGRRPELVRRVVLGNTWAWPTETSEPRGMFSIIAGGPIGEFVQTNFNGFAKLGVDNGIIRELEPEVAALYLRPFVPLDRRGIAAFYPGQITAARSDLVAVEAGLGALADRPALIFWGMKDQGFPRADLERFEAAFSDHRTVLFPDADHFFFEDESAAMLAAIATFMGS